MTSSPASDYIGWPAGGPRPTKSPFHPIYALPGVRVTESRLTIFIDNPRCERPYGGRDPEQPTLSFLDIKIPRVDGIEAFRQLKSDQRTARVPIIASMSSDQTWWDGYSRHCQARIKNGS